DNQATVERLVEETCPSPPTPIITKKKTANKLNLPGPTIKDSEGLGNVASNTPRSDELLAHPQKVPQRGENSEILQWMESTIIQT
ncbi:hypothetical protein O181_131436, partial [Austropuccinia psidii MF-1]|nr:hypothetical protein [Austropuccinia psidii MF-1]